MEKNKKELNPSDFKKIFPRNSVFHNYEHELVAKNIMVILDRTGNIFRELSYDEYVEHRLKDGNYSMQEKYYFDNVQKYCVSSEKVMTFSASWNI